jgi:ABC-type dipeptide/oligopeptide/nickel transport system permease component
MLRHALRRLLWIVPILIGVTLTSFAFLSYVPDPADDPTVLSSLTDEQARELRRSRFLDLPRLFNDHPVDLVRRADEAFIHVAAGDERAAPMGAALVQLGGAALPYVLPRLDALDPAARARVALALAPVARRMGIASAESSDPSRAVAFWNRFWADRAIDFRAPNARRAVRRLSLHATSMRETELLELDTFALDQTMVLLEELSSAAGRQDVPDPKSRVAAITRLVDAAAHVTERDDRVAERASEAEALACVRRWREWWLFHQSDFTAYGGIRRLVATISDTQYSKWAQKVLVLGFGAGSDDSPVLERMGDRAPTTLAILGGSFALAYALALLFALLGALYQRAAGEVVAIGISLVALAIPTACLGSWVSLRMSPGVVSASSVLALSLFASPLAQLRAALLDFQRRDYFRAARALGFGRWPVLVRQGLRSGLLPLVAVASVQLPLALGGAFVVEKVFGLKGLGEETVLAVQTHDVAWLVGLAFITALAVTLTSIAADLATAALDPRLSLAALRNERIVE